MPAKAVRSRQQTRQNRAAARRNQLQLRPLHPKAARRHQIQRQHRIQDRLPPPLRPRLHLRQARASDDPLALYVADFFLAGGTFAPALRASDRPIAIACLGFVTFCPLRPDFSLPCFIAFISRSTDAEALGPYFFALEFFFVGPFLLALFFFVGIAFPPRK